MIHLTVKHNRNTNYVVLTETESGVYYSVPYDTQTFSSKDEYRHEVTFKGRLGKVSFVVDNSVDGKFIQFRFGDDLSGYSIGLFYGECNREVTSGGNLFTYNFMRDCGNKRDTFLQRHVISFYKNVLNIGYRVSFELSEKDARALKRFLSGLC